MSDPGGPVARRVTILVLTAGLLLAAAPVAGAANVSPADWRVNPDAQYTNVPAPSQEYEFAQPSPRPTADGGHKFGVRMPRVAQNRPPNGRKARLGIAVLFSAVEADEMVVRFWVKHRTPSADPPGDILMFVHCPEDLKWARVGRRKVDRDRQDVIQMGKTEITDEDCAGAVVDGMMLVNQGADDADDHRWRRVFLAEAAIRRSSMDVVVTDFTHKT
jgi:hypothetical protein